MRLGLFMMPLHPSYRAIADSDDPAWDHESLRLLAEEVAPRIADLG